MLGILEMQGLGGQTFNAADFGSQLSKSAGIVRLEVKFEWFQKPN